MEKEQKKLLLVAVSVGVFLLVTITAAIAILSPKANIQETAYSPIQQYPSGGIKPVTVDTQPAPSAQEAKPSQTDTSGPAVDINENDRLTINVVNKLPTAVGVPDTQETPPKTKNVAAVAPAPVEKPAAPKPAAKPAASPSATPKAKTTKDYWVQTGAFSAKIRAEDSRELLASKGITSIIENSEVNGKTWYRVRVGPYTSENEANYWLALVKTIDGFGGSQVRQTAR
jgi:DedD protein